MKYVAFFDLDKVLYNDHTFFQFADFELKKGRITQDDMDQILGLLGKYKKGEYTYSKTATLLLELFAESLKGQTYETIENDVKEYFEKNSENFYDYAKTLLPKLKEKYDIYLITTNAQYIAKYIMEKFQLQGYISSEYEVIDGRISGNVTKSLADSNGKNVVKEILEQYGFKGSMAVGDSENDVGMLELVEFPICLNPNEKLKAIADEKKWVVTSDFRAQSTILQLFDIM